MNLEPYFLYVLLSANALLLAIACLAVLRFEWRWKRIEQFWDSPTGAALDDAEDDEMRAQLAAIRNLEKRLGELQRSVMVLDLNSPRETPTAERSLPIENAMRMARNGASVEELTRTCGLNVGEARLLQKLHGQASRTARPH